MNKTSERESLCEYRFRTEGPYWHIWTSENHPIIFTVQSDFKAAMGIMGIAARLCPNVRIITFEWMSNHVHIVAAGIKEDILSFLDMLRLLLVRHFNGEGHIGDSGADESTRSKSCAGPSEFSHDGPGPIDDRFVDLSGFSFSYRELNSLSEVRNVIAYDNRNGYLVSPDESPYSYPWGANRYYFNPDSKTVYNCCGRKLTVQECRKLTHSHLADKITSLKTVYGYACPMDFCSIAEGEQLFTSASQYFHSVSKSVESYKSIAEELSENIFLTDEEMFSLACRISSEQYHTRIRDLTGAAKVEVAKSLHFDYHAGNKQIARILKMPQSLVDTLIPKTGRS